MSENGIPTAPCHSKKLPLWLVLLDNIPTLLLFILGYMIIKEKTNLGALIFIFYAAFSIFWFWYKICPHCHHFNSFACPCGYGKISSKMFSKRDNGSFKKIFKRNILVVFPNWFVPFGIAIYLLLTDYSSKILVLTILFSLIGFIIIPLISKLAGCKNCDIKSDCPWMNINKKELVE